LPYAQYPLLTSNLKIIIAVRQTQITQGIEISIQPDYQEQYSNKSTGSWYQVRTKDNEILNCRIRGKFKLNNLQLTNPVAVGDKVKLIIEKEEGTGLIKTILPRQNYVVRQSPRQKHNLHLLASNVDQAIIYMTVAQPKLKQGFIDRFLLMTEPHNIPTIIVFNKADVYTEKDLETYESLKGIYEEIGYKTILTSSVSKLGIPELKAVLKDKITLISGQSGVGKSTSTPLNKVGLANCAIKIIY